MRSRFAIVGFLAMLGCGPSLRMVHESTVYFERCHEAELLDQVSLETKTECWNRWLRWYSHSQTGTRVLYARERLVLLTQGELTDPLPVASDASAESGVSLPQDTRVVPPSAPPTRPTSRRAPRQFGGHPVCEPVCRPRWDGCLERCDSDSSACIAACQTEYTNCMSGCI